MELRGYSHLHFIQAIKGNLIIKLLNVNRGRPELRYKKVNEISEAGSVENHDSVSTIRPSNELESFHSNPKRGKFEILCLPLAERRTVNFDTSEFNCSHVDEVKSSNLGGGFFGDITLKEIKDCCKARKRKCAEYVDLSKETSDNLFPSKQVHSNLEAKPDELDLNEPIILWKSKISKNKKRKRKCIRSHTSTSSHEAVVIVKAEQDPVDQNFLQLSDCLLEPTDIKLEVDELDYTNFQTEIHVAADSSFHNKQVVGFLVHIKCTFC